MPAPKPVQEDENDELIRELKNTGKPPVYRVGIARMFGDKRVEKAGPALAEALHSRLPELQEAAVIAIGKVGYMPAWTELMHILGTTTDRYLQWEAAVSLGEIKSRQSVGPIIGLLDSKSGSLRKCAAFILGEMGAKQAVGALMLSLGDKDPEVRLQSARALGKLGNPDALPALRDLARRSSGNVKAAAREAIEAIGNSQEGEK
jgi:HEAT repeat protein